MNFLLKRSHDLLALLGLLAVWSFFHHRILFEGHTFFLMDSSGFFFPLWKWGGQWFSRGVLPLWNPDVAFGRPYWADPQMAVWYPPLRVAYAWMTPENAFRFLVAGHQLWGAAGFYFFSRGRGFSPILAWVGCLAFGFSFHAVSLMEISVMIFAFSWIPWVFLTGWKLWEKPGSGAYLGFSLCLGLQAASGYPLYAYLTVFFLFLDLGVRSFPLLGTTQEKRRIKGWLGWSSLAGLTAVVLNLAWILPLGEFLKYTNIDQRLALTQGLQWKHLASWLDPFYAGHPLHSYAGTDPTVSVYFVGLPVATLLLWGVLRSKIQGPTLFLLLLTFVLSTGPLLVLGDWFKAVLPGFHWVVRSGYIISWVVFYGVWAALQAYQALSHEKGGSKEDGGWVLVVFMVAAGALLLGVPWDLSSFWVGLIFLLLVRSISLRHQTLGGFFLAASLLLSLGPVVQSLHLTVPGDFYRDVPKVVTALNEPGRIFHDYGVIQKGEAVSGNSIQEAYEKLRGDLLPNWPLNFGREEVFDHNSLFLNGFLKWWYGAPRISKAFSKKVMDYLNVRYYLGADPAPGFRKIELAPAPDPLWVDPTPLAKWNSVERALPATSWDQDLLWASSHSFDFSKNCFVAAPIWTGGYEHRALTYATEGPNALELLTPGGGKALLVSSETAFPGWVVKVDGQEKSWGVVNHHFRGLVLEAGQKNAVMAYRPTTIRLGIFMALLAIGLWVGIGIQWGAKNFARI